jgi:glutaredoxin
MNKNTPECPFCKRFISRPDEIKTEFGSVLGGSCECGTVYVCDPTGHNTGEAYMEALALAKGNWQINSIEENVDYETVNLDYDEKTHQVLYSKGLSSLSGRLVFIKVKMQQEESSQEETGTHPISPLTAEMGCVPVSSITQGSKVKVRERVRDLLELKAYDEVAAMARQNKGVIRWLISFTYDKQDVISWRAIEAIGVISRTCGPWGKNQEGLAGARLRCLAR